MGKDTKGKGNTCAKKIKGRKSVAEKQDIHEAMHNFLKHPHWWNEFPWIGFMIRKSWFEAIACVYVSRLALDPPWALSLGVSPNQEHLSLKQGFFLSLTKWSYFFPLWAGIVLFSSPEDFILVFIFHKSLHKEHPCGNFVNDIC